MITFGQTKDGDSLFHHGRTKKKTLERLVSSGDFVYNKVLGKWTESEDWNEIYQRTAGRREYHRALSVQEQTDHEIQKLKKLLVLKTAGQNWHGRCESLGIESRDSEFSGK